MTCLIPYGCCVSVPSLLRYYVLSIVRGQSLCCLAFLHLTADINQRMMENCSILLFAVESGLKSVLSTHQTLWGRENMCVGKVLMWVSMSHYPCPTRLFPLSRKRSCIIHFSSLHLCWQLRNGLSERNPAQRSFKWGETKLSLVFLFWRTYALFLRKTTTTTKNLEHQPWIKAAVIPHKPKGTWQESSGFGYKELGCSLWLHNDLLCDLGQVRFPFCLPSAKCGWRHL